MKKVSTRSVITWTRGSAIVAVALVLLALSKGQTVSAIWIIAAALGSYAIAYRFYAQLVAHPSAPSLTDRAVPSWPAPLPTSPSSTDGRHLS